MSEIEKLSTDQLNDRVMELAREYWREKTLFIASPRAQDAGSHFLRMRELNAEYEAILQELGERDPETKPDAFE